MIRAARATDLRDDSCESPSWILTQEDLDRVLRELSGTRARFYEFCATHSRLHIRFNPQDREPNVPRYDLLFIGTVRCEVSTHFTVTGAMFTSVEDGIDGSHTTFECNGGETKISASDVLLIVQDDETLLDLDTLTKAEQGSAPDASPGLSFQR